MRVDADSSCFRLLVVDSDHEATSDTAEHLLYSIASNARLIKAGAKVDTVKGTVTGPLAHFAVASVARENNTDLPTAFVVEVSGKLGNISSVRKVLLEHFKNEQFGARYVLTDDVSQRYAELLYPLIYQVENALRGYLIQFMVTQIGPNWWNLTATSEQAQKAQQRKGNESFFGPLVDSRAYLIDFGDLGRIVYEQSSGFRTRDEIVKRVLDLEEDKDSVAKLKQELQSNYVKFFKESFKDKEFQAKWELLEKLRNKVAHNGLISHEDFSHGEMVATELLQIVTGANDSVTKVEIREQDRQAIKENVERSYAFPPVSSETFLRELQAAEAYFSRRGGFVGLYHFVHVWLGNQGYDFRSSFEMVDRLEESELLRKYDVVDGGPAVVALASNSQRSPRMMPGMAYAKET
jgi:hypothetical protein